MTDKNSLYAIDLSKAVWIKSTKSETDMNECVEITQLPGGAVALRDSNMPDRGHLCFTHGEWSAFVSGASAGEFGK